MGEGLKQSALDIVCGSVGSCHWPANCLGCWNGWETHRVSIRHCKGMAATRYTHDRYVYKHSQMGGLFSSEGRWTVSDRLFNMKDSVDSTGFVISYKAKIRVFRHLSSVPWPKMPPSSWRIIEHKISLNPSTSSTLRHPTTFPSQVSSRQAESLAPVPPWSSRPSN